MVVDWEVVADERKSKSGQSKRDLTWVHLLVGNGVEGAIVGHLLFLLNFVEADRRLVLDERRQEGIRSRAKQTGSEPQLPR